MNQEAKSTGVWKQKALFIQSTLQIKQIQKKLQQDWVIHISNKLKEKNPIIFHSISLQRTITTDYSLHVLMTLPLPPRGSSTSLAQLWKLPHLLPFYVSPQILFSPFRTLQVHTTACLQFLITILWFLPAAREKSRENTQTHPIRCAWHITLHLSVHLSSPRFNFPKRSEVWPKSSLFSNPKPGDQEQLKVPLSPISSFSTDNKRGSCWANVVEVLHIQLQFCLQRLGSEKLNEGSKPRTQLSVELEPF